MEAFAAEVADRFEVPGASQIIERVIDAVHMWPTFADEAGVPRATAARIAGHIAAWSSPLR